MWSARCRSSRASACGEWELGRVAEYVHMAIAGAGRDIEVDGRPHGVGRRERAGAQRRKRNAGGTHGAERLSSGEHDGPPCLTYGLAVTLPGGPSARIRSA